MSEKPDVIFLSVQDNRSKLGKIVTACHEHYAKGERVLIRVDSDAAASFLDDHLWVAPADSFLPHEITHEKSRDPLILTTADRNLNDATVLIHLCKEASQMPLRFKLIYDLKDETTQDKLQHSRERYRAYQQRALPLSIR